MLPDVGQDFLGHRLLEHDQRVLKDAEDHLGPQMRHWHFDLCLVILWEPKKIAGRLALTVLEKDRLTGLLGGGRRKTISHYGNSPA